MKFLRKHKFVLYILCFCSDDDKICSMSMMRRWCFGTFQDLRGSVMSTVNVQSFLNMSRHIDQDFIRFWDMFYCLYKYM